MKCIEYAKEYIRQKGFKIIREDEHYISFYYQMNCIYLFDNEEQDDFMVVSLPDFTDITQDRSGKTNNRTSKLYIKTGKIIYQERYTVGNCRNILLFAE